MSLVAEHQVSLPLATRPSMAAKLAAFFEARPGQWINARDLEFAGRQAWRTRVSELRHQPFNMDIPNRQRRVMGTDGAPYTVSEYRFVP